MKNNKLRCNISRGATYIVLENLERNNGKKGKEVHKLGGESLIVFITTRDDVACHALVSRRLVFHLRWRR